MNLGYEPVTLDWVNKTVEEDELTLECFPNFGDLINDNSELDSKLF